MSFWAATVILNFLEVIPFSGIVIKEFFLGYSSTAAPVQKRFLSLHWTIAFILAGFILFHLYFLHLNVAIYPSKQEGEDKVEIRKLSFDKDFHALC